MLTADDEAWVRSVAAKMESLAKRIVVAQAMKRSQRSQRLERAFTNVSESLWRLQSAADALREELVADAANKAAEATRAEMASKEGEAHGQ